MSRYGLLLLAMALLDGCGSAPAEAPHVAAQPLQPGELHCRAVARERANDSLANGYSFDIEESVYRETYDECMSWRARDGAR